MGDLNLTKACPQCGEPIAAWYKRLLAKDRATARDITGSTPAAKFTTSSFACSACRTPLVLTCAGAHLVQKLAGAVFAGLVAGFIVPAFIGLAACFICAVFFAGLLAALFASWVAASAVTVERVKTATRKLS